MNPRIACPSPRARATLNPHLLHPTDYVQVNEMGQMALQYGMTGYVKRLVVGADVSRDMTMSEEFASAIAGGVLVAPFSSSVECVMIQQQRKVSMLVALQLHAAVPVMWLVDCTTFIPS